MKNKSDGRKTSIRQRIAEHIDISSEIILDYIVIKMSGNHELVLENYKGILDYSDTAICVKAKPMPLKIKGTCLELRTITDEILCITGEIGELSFTNEV